VLATKTLKFHFRVEITLSEYITSSMYSWVIFLKYVQIAAVWKLETRLYRISIPT